MVEPQIRGHVLDHTARFYRSAYDYSTIARIEGELSIEVKAALDAMSPSAWYPRRFQVELLSAFATVRGRSDSTYGDFLRCGASLAQPNNEFVSLLMKLMTPELFVKKVPRFWARDHQSSGDIEVSTLGAGERGARIRLRSVQNYDHGAILWLGFIQSILAQLGASGLVVRQEGWSWSSPGPQDIAYEARWT